MTYFIIRDTLIIIYIKNLNKTNGQTRCLKVKKVTYFGTDGVLCCFCRLWTHLYLSVAKLISKSLQKEKITVNGHLFTNAQNGYT